MRAGRQADRQGQLLGARAQRRQDSWDPAASGALRGMQGVAASPMQAGTHLLRVHPPRRSHHLGVPGRAAAHAGLPRLRGWAQGGGGHRRVRRQGAPPCRRSTALPLRCGQLAPRGPRRPPFWHPAACTPLPLRDACLGERERRDGVCRREVLDDGGGGAVQVSVLRAGCVCTRRACVAGRVAGGALEGRGNLSRRQHSSPPHHVGIALAHVSLDQQLVLLSVPPRQHKVVLWARRGRGEVSAACEGGGQARARSQAVALAAGAWQAMRRSPASQPLQGRQPHPHPRR